MAAADSEQKELLALMHQHLVRTGYKRAAKELLRQSGQKTFPSSSVSLQDIFAQWKKTCSQAQRQKVDDTKKNIPAKVRVSDPKSSSESSDEEEAANTIRNKANLSVNNISVREAATSSEEEDSSSEEEAVAGTVKTPGSRNKTTDPLQLAAQKTNSFPGKGVAVAAVQPKEQQKKAAASKPLPPAAGRTGQNKTPPGQQGAALPPSVGQRPTRAQGAAAKKVASSESSSSSSNSSSSCENEEEKAQTTGKLPPPKPDLKKSESSSGDSSDDSDSEEETNAAAAVQVKAGIPGRQVSSTLAKSSPANVAPSKACAVKVPPPAKGKANQVSTEATSAARSTEPADSSETSDSSDSEDEALSSAAQAKLPGKAAQASTPPLKTAPSSQALDRVGGAPTSLNQTPKPSATSLAKVSSAAKKAGNSESSSSSSEIEDEAPPVPVSQKVKAGIPGRQVSSTLAKTPSKVSAVKVAPPAKGKANQVSTEATSAARSTEPADSSETSNSSDSEDEALSSAAQAKLPGKAAQASTPPLKAPPSSQALDRVGGAPTSLNQTPKPSVTSLAKVSSAAKKAGNSESSSSSSESEDEAAPLPVSQKVKAGIPGRQVSSTLAKSSPANVAPSKASAVKVAPPAKGKANQVSTEATSAARSTEPADSSEASDSSDSEDEAPSSAAQAKLPGKAAQASTPPLKAPPSSQALDRVGGAPTSLNQTPKPSVTSLAKVSSAAKKAGNSESSSSSSESEDEAPPVPVSQKVKAGIPGRQVSSTLAKSSPANVAPSKASAVKVAPPAKGKANQVTTEATSAARNTEPADSSEASDSSDSEDEAPSSAAQAKLPGKAAQASTPLLKTPPSSQALDRVGGAPTSLNQTPKPSVTSLAKVSSAAKKAGNSESSSSSSESEDEAPPVPVSQKVKAGIPGRQVSSTLAKSSPANVAPSKASAVKVAPPAKGKANQVSTEATSAARSTEPADSSEASDSSDSEDEALSSAAQAKLHGKAAQASTPPLKTPPSSQALDRVGGAPTSLNQTPKPSVTSLAKVSSAAKKAGNSESSSSSSESEDEAPPVPRLQTPQPPTGSKQNQDNKAGSLVKVAPSALKGKEVGSESRSSSDSEDEAMPAALRLPPLSASKANMAGQPTSVPKPQPVSTSPQEAQQSEDSSQDSSDESDSKEDTVFIQKLSPVKQKPAPAPPAKALAAKGAGAAPGQVGRAQPTGKKRASPAKAAKASPPKTSKSSETDSSDSSERKAAGKPASQPPIHPFFKQIMGKGATPSAKSAQANSSTPSSMTSKSQGPGTGATGKVERSLSKKAKLSQNRDLPVVLLRRIDSLGSSNSLDSKEDVEEVKTPAVTAIQIPQTGVPQKQGAIKEAESSSEDSSDDDEEPSQSLLASSSGSFKTPACSALKSAPSMPSKPISGRTGASVTGALAKTPGKPALAGPSSSDSSDSETDVEKTVGTEAEISVPASSGKSMVVAKAGKEAAAETKRPGSSGPKASKAKKATGKAQSNGKAKGAPPVLLPPSPRSNTQPAEDGSRSKEEAAAHRLGAGGQEGAGASPVVAAVKTPNAAKMPMSGEKKKLSKKRKLAAGEASLGETNEKKLKVQSLPEAVAKKKKKKKKKSKTLDDMPKKKEGKEKKVDKKKKKGKKLESLSEDGLQKKKKKKKKSGNLEETA